MTEAATVARPPRGRRIAAAETVVQMEVAECGAACLVSVMARFKTHRTLEEVRQVCGVSRDGSNALGIIEAARYYGFEADGLSLEADRLAELPLPAILHWGFNHFVVLEGWKGGSWVLMDPAVGRRLADAQEMFENFTGIALQIEPGPEHAPSGEAPSAWTALSRRLVGSWGVVALATMAGAVLAVPGLVVPALSAIFVDQVLTDHHTDWMPVLVSMAVLAILLQALVAWTQSLLLVRLEQRMAVTASTTYLASILRLPIEFFVHRMGGDLVHRVGANDSIASLVAGHYAPAVLALGMSAAYLAALIVVDPLLGTLAAGAAGLIAVLMFMASRAATDTARTIEREWAVRVGLLGAGLSSIETLKAGGREADFFARIDGAGARVRIAMQRGQVLQATLESLPGLVEWFFVTAVVLSVGGWKVMQGEMTLGALLAFQTIVLAFLAPVLQLAALWREVQQSRADLTRLDDVLRHGGDPLTSDTGAELLQVAGRGELQLESVTFGYSAALEPLIENLSLHIRPGQRVALVGGTGSGKTTVGRIAAGLLQPWKGRVLLDGRELARWSRHDRSSLMAVVSQSVVLFECSVRDNLTLMDQTIPEEWLREALDDAQMTEALSLRGGLDAPVAEGGSNFSGGQLQRLEFARALARRPALLILDEATSALDVQTEVAIERALARRGVASLVIAHRLSTVRDADEIIVLDRGAVAERGNHDQLMRQQGIYSRLVGGQP